MAEVKCGCRAEHCEHPGGICGKPVSVTLKMSAMVGKAIFSEVKETGICEDCYAKAQEAIPWVFPKK
jgi:hypothetical protein